MLFVLLLTLAFGAISNLGAQITVTVGEGDEIRPDPWTFYRNNSLFQALYYQSEIGMFGNITALKFYNSFTDYLSNKPIKIWLGSTAEEDLSAGWIDPTTLTLVYDGTINFPTGENTITIPLQVPYTYGSGNLVFYTYKPVDNYYHYYYNAYFYGQTVGTNRVRKVSSDSSIYDPLMPSVAGYTSGTFPKTTFTIVPLSDEPFFVVSPPEADFGSVQLPHTAHQDFYVSNAGAGILGINSISITGDDSFTLTDIPDLPASLNTGETLIFGLDYSPGAADEHIAQITITDDFSYEVHTIEVTGDSYDSTIYSLPFMENWDTVNEPNFPLGWNTIQNSTSTTAYVATYSSLPNSEPNCVRFYNSSDANAQLYLLSPPIANDIDISDIRIKVIAKGNSGCSLQIGSMSDPADSGTFALAQDLTVYPIWNEYVINLTEHTAAGSFIAIRHGLGGTNRSVHVDDLTFELIAPNDLAAVSITGNTTPSVNVTTNYTVKVFNNGTATQSDYQVQIVDDQGAILVSVAGADIAPGETVSTILSYTPTTEGPQTIIGKVVLLDDINSVNDTSSPLDLLIQARDFFYITVGEGNQMRGIPWEFFYKNSLFQTLYYPDELVMFGQIVGISFYNNFTSNMTNKPIKLWLGTTTEADLSAGWIDPNSLTMVYDGTMDFPSGENIVTIPLTTPFNYFSDNLVLYANRPMDMVYHHTDDDFYAQTVGYQRSRKLQNNNINYDPMNPSGTGTLSATLPKTTFLMTVDGTGSLSGTVTTAGSPLTNVEISIDGTTFDTVTSASGQYSFPYLQEGDYGLFIHKVGYEDQSISFSIMEDQNTTVDILMIPSSSVNVIGSVTGSNASTEPLSEVIVTLTGVLNYSATGNASGQFVIENVLSGNTYNYVISRAGYQATSGSIIVGSSDYDMGNIILEELTLPPSTITATVNDAETAIDLIWTSPGSVANFHFFDFELDDGNWVPGSNWTDPLGDWEYTDSYDVSQWSPPYHAPNVNPPNTAHSGTGMWGTIIYSNPNYSSGFSYLTQTFDFSSIENAQLSFWSWENLYGPWNYAQVSINGIRVWGPSWDYAGTTWQERIIDLSAYDGMGGVELRFEMYASSPSTSFAGWYIDDVCIGSADRVVRSSPPSVIPNELQGLSKLQAAELTESKASSHLARKMVNSPRQPMYNPSRLPVGYRVWRLEHGQENFPDQWVSLTPAMITDTTFTDPAWASFPDGIYRWAVRTIYTNDVLSNPGFSNSIRKQPNDMSALNISGNINPMVGALAYYTVRVKNTGTAPQAAGAYAVKIMSGNTELASVAGPTIGVAEEIGVTVSWVPSAEGSITLYGKVVLPEDSQPANDQTDPIFVLVMPAGQTICTVGEGDQLAWIPVDMSCRSSLFQMIIYPDELSNFFGFINGIQFYNNFFSDLSAMPTRVWVGTTTQGNLSGGWISTAENSTLVFDGNVDYPSGENAIPIFFNEPFMYLNGENILVTVHRPMDTHWHDIYDRFRAQTVGTDRARCARNSTIEYDPTVPPTDGTTSGQFPMTTFFMFASDLFCHVSGVITDAVNNDTLEDVLVQIEGCSNEAISNADGEYQIQYIMPDTYDLHFSKNGYITQTHELELEEGEEAVINVALQPMPKVAVSGTILASDTGSGLAGAVVALTGYANYSENTSGNGEFTFPAVYANESYAYVITCPGYTSINGIIDVAAMAYQMGTITLCEIAHAPQNLEAELNTTYIAVELEWEAPDPNAADITESFENTTFPPQGWSQIITNTGTQNSYGVYPTFKRLGTIEIDGHTNAIPTHGGFQTGLWWSYEHQNEWLITPTFNCLPNAYLRFDSYVFLGSTNGDHYCVKVSSDGGNSWQVLWDASAETGGQNAYDTPFVVDLAAYEGQQITLAFQAEDPDTNGGLWFYWFIDNIYIGNAIAPVSFDGPALIRHSLEHGSNMPAAEALTRDGRALIANNVKPVTKAKGRDSRALIGYEIYRFISGQETNEASWVLLNDELINILTFEDEGWETLPYSTYRWGVKAVYTADVSSPVAFSNALVKESDIGNIVGFVRRINGQGIAGATVSADTYQATTNTAGAYSLILPVGSYSVTASAENYKSVTVDDVVVSPNQNTTLDIVLDPVASEDELSPVTATVLKGNSPNPFNPTTTIYYDILEPCNVRLDVYNVKGQKVRSLLNEAQSRGRHSIVFEALDEYSKSLSSGIYFYRFTAGKYKATRKMLLME